jgi:hypothetical protein
LFVADMPLQRPWLDEPLGRFCRRDRAEPGDVLVADLPSTRRVSTRLTRSRFSVSRKRVNMV